ncbi:MAG: hypothetical protein GWP14_10905, partial [Actinobacteria bacterium]|nr:hypothetical protein [Actinomycetota bacterium]
MNTSLALKTGFDIRSTTTKSNQPLADGRTSHLSAPSVPWLAEEPGMKILMLGWEFPPFISGGLGTACYGLTSGMSQIGAEVLFVLPRPVADQCDSHVKIVSPADVKVTGGAVDGSACGVEQLPNVSIRTVDAALQPYSTQTEYVRQLADLAVLQEVFSPAQSPAATTTAAA